MKDLGIKFTIYDFLAYFLPGFLVFIFWEFGNAIISLNYNLIIIDYNSIFNNESKSLYGALFSIIILYLIGYFISITSYYLIESWFLKSALGKRIYNFENKIGSDLLDKHKECFESFLKIPYSERHKIHAVSFVCNKLPNLYDRIFFFITTSAQSRNFLLVFLLLNPIIIWLSFNYKEILYLLWLLPNLLLCLLLFHNYIKFKHYYEREVIYAFIEYSSKKEEVVNLQT